MNNGNGWPETNRSLTVTRTLNQQTDLMLFLRNTVTTPPPHQLDVDVAPWCCSGASLGTDISCQNTLMHSIPVGFELLGRQRDKGDSGGQT